MSYVVLDAEFVRSAPTLKVAQEAEDNLPEVAFIGRSNVGKSSLIAELLQRKKLIKISKNPGHTRALNFFRVHARSPEGDEKTFMLVDLPGYGFARISNKERLRMSALLTGYLGEREELSAVCQLLDLRHSPTADDRSMAAQLGTRDYRHIIVATKADKLAGAKRKPACRKLASSMERDVDTVTLFSASAHLGRELLWAQIWAAL